MNNMLVLGVAGGTVTDALTTAMTSTASECTSAIGAVLPVALPVMGALIVVGIGVKVFKKVVGTR